MRRNYVAAAQVNFLGVVIHFFLKPLGGMSRRVDKKSQICWKLTWQQNIRRNHTQSKKCHCQARDPRELKLDELASPGVWPDGSEVMNTKPKSLFLVGIKKAEVSCFSTRFQTPLGYSDVTGSWEPQFVECRLTNSTWNDLFHYKNWTRFSLILKSQQMWRYFRGETSPNKTNITTVWGWIVYIFTG